MAEQSSRDVVDQTLSGGEPSPSDVPASTNDNQTAGGDLGVTKHIATTTDTRTNLRSSDLARADETTNTGASPVEATGHDKDAGTPAMDSPKSGTGLVANRALELNGLASGSDAGDDTASQGGSESDASRTDGMHHARSSSVKRPSTFKPVSFAKFSVPKAPGASAPPKAPEKAASSTSTTPLGTPQPSLRPRLVAKTTAGNSFSKTSTGAAKPGGTSDTNQVWNKNRPAQPAPSKHLTDEELKQQYGIHMTSRIQEDGGGSEAKWADIDDDEDDWAPETIEWTDGTKVTLTHTDHVPPPGHDDHASHELQQPPPPEPVPVREPLRAPKPTTSMGPNPTVLRLGANAERQAKIAGASKGAGDRDASGSTSPAPPTKSPWAPLPRVERASPVMPSAQMAHHPRGSVNQMQRDEGYQAPLPPQEIAADDFTRTWRETQPGAPRELYNSRSGRYEPVSDTRRGSYRHDQHPRAPAVLQRSAHAEGGPAEPSAAFQTHRSSNQDGMGWSRRRASSNVSGGSGGFGRRMSIGRPDAAAPRYMENRRGSQVNGMVDPALMGREPPHAKEGPFRDMSPSRQQARPPTHEAAPTETQPPAVPEAPQEDPVAVQERIMKEKRMEARQRRIEQEQKEEAAKQERIRQRLAALGPAPEKAKRKESTEARKPEAQPTAPPATVVNSPPKPPVPEPTGEPKQYGMMKVHHPDTVKKLVAANERDRATEKATMPASRRISSPHQHKREIASAANGPKPQQAEPQPQGQGKPDDAQVDEHGAQWRDNLNVTSPYAPWTTNPNLASTSPSVKNPWKPLSSDKTLGNGIFEQGLGGFPSRDMPLRSQLGLDQQAMGAPSQAPFPGSARSPQEPSAISPLPSPEVRHASYDPLSPIGRPGPIGPPSSQAPQWQQQQPQGGLTSWNNFHNVAAQREAEQSEKFRQEFITSRDRSLPPVTFKETWKQIRPGEEAGGRRIVNISRNVVTDNNSPPNPLTGLDAPAADGLPFSDSHARPLVNVPARSSRFFPNVTEQSKRPAMEKTDYQRSPSPPPPEELSSHPVYFGDPGRPQVHFPTPKAVVKLPPKALAGPPPPPSFASMAAAAPRAQPSTMSWQEKINGLFAKKGPPEKKSVLAVSSASKEPLDVQLPVAAVSVSLPHKAEHGAQIGDGDISVTQMEEQDEIFEDREPGSLPAVRVPNMAPPAAWVAAPSPSVSRLRAKNLKPMQVHSIEPFLVGLHDKDQSGNLCASVRFPGTIAAKTLALPKKGGSHQGSRHRSSTNFKTRKNTKPREEQYRTFFLAAASVPKCIVGTSHAQRFALERVDWNEISVFQVLES
ncbi:hypothetical protein N7474_007143 [Penicillium riverlandense]|uniref:uncharacterized protein n=1 Tax=Penicillium riverlandense TaxID=1903569 RepID=UPI0025499949|nr:uncharacterized protein N7474_007143 [Penicillium riverlandense]KAJ5815366.1 hypothetical protein N7474_007143 [Penicillium riverlandense]